MVSFTVKEEKFPEPYLPEGRKKRIREAFLCNGMTIRVESDHVIVNEDAAREKISAIIETAGFCPIISPNRINRKICFTITPYRVPERFYENPYLSKDEISHSLRHRAFVGSRERVSIPDRWSPVNNFRDFVLSALNQAISDVVSVHANDNKPIVEIGSGIGYNFPEALSSQIVRTQSCVAECELLRRLIPDPMYHMDIEALHNSLLSTGKKISLVFALNVFDTMSSAERIANLSRIYSLQRVGDQVLIMLDTNPDLVQMFRELSRQYPEHAILPYFPMKKDPSKMSVILVPLELTSYKVTRAEVFDKIITDEVEQVFTNGVSRMQEELVKLKSKHDLKSIVLEDFFVAQVKAEFAQVGYESTDYYHASFTTGPCPTNLGITVGEDLIYKQVTDTYTVRQWSLAERGDPKLLAALTSKKLRIPEYINGAFLLDLRRRNQKLFGAEILVIRGTKI